MQHKLKAGTSVAGVEGLASGPWWATPKRWQLKQFKMKLVAAKSQCLYSISAKHQICKINFSPECNFCSNTKAQNISPIAQEEYFAFFSPVANMPTVTACDTISEYFHTKHLANGILTLLACKMMKMSHSVASLVRTWCSFCVQVLVVQKMHFWRKSEQKLPG